MYIVKFVNKIEIHLSHYLQVLIDKRNFKAISVSTVREH